MKNIGFLFLITISLSLCSCSKECDEPDIQRINALYFQLKEGGDDGFSSEAIEQIYLIRFVPFSEPLLADTLYLQGNYPLGRGEIFINDQFPFTNQESPYFTTYGYMIVDPTTGYVGNIENIQLEGQYDGDCGYENTQKSFFFNGDSINMAGSMNFFVVTP